MADKPIGEGTHKTLYLEDFKVGDILPLGTTSASVEDIMAFARQFDPLPIHIDKEWAETEGPFGGLIASGWHTAAMTSRLLGDGCFRRSAVICGIGMDELRWPSPVRPDEQLTGKFTVTETLRSRSKPDRGAVTARVEIFADDGRMVLSLLAKTLIRAAPVASE